MSILNNSSPVSAAFIDPYDLNVDTIKADKGDTKNELIEQLAQLSFNEAAPLTSFQKKQVEILSQEYASTMGFSSSRLCNFLEPKASGYLSL